MFWDPLPYHKKLVYMQRTCSKTYTESWPVGSAPHWSSASAAKYPHDRYTSSSLSQAHAPCRTNLLTPLWLSRRHEADNGSLSTFFGWDQPKNHKRCQRPKKNTQRGSTCKWEQTLGRPGTRNSQVLMGFNSPAWGSNWAMNEQAHMYWPTIRLGSTFCNYCDCVADARGTCKVYTHPRAPSAYYCPPPVSGWQV